MKDIDVLQGQIDEIKDMQINRVCYLINSKLNTLIGETRARAKELEDRVNNLSSILIKKTDKKVLEKVISEIT